MATIDELFVNCQVKYKPHYFDDDEFELGIVKEIRPSNKNYVWVVFHCNGDWKNFHKYTAAMTPIEDLQIGW